MGEQGVLEPAQGGLKETPDSTSISSLITQISLHCQPHPLHTDMLARQSSPLRLVCSTACLTSSHPPSLPHPDPRDGVWRYRDTLWCFWCITAVLLWGTDGADVLLHMTPQMSLVFSFGPFLSLSLTRCPSVNTLMSGHLKAPGSPAGPRRLIIVCLCFVGAIFTNRGCSSFLIVSHETGCRHRSNHRQR